MKRIVSEIYKIIKVILVCLLVVVTLSLMIMKLMGDTPVLFGYNLYYIASGSMEPTLQVGDIILSKVPELDELQVSDIITYQGTTGQLKDKIITHQIVEIEKNNGEVSIITKGTANIEEDPPIRPDQVMSVMVMKLPLLGKALNLLNTPVGFFVLIFIPLVILLINELWVLFNVLKKTDKEENDEEGNI